MPVFFDVVGTPRHPREARRSGLTTKCVSSDCQNDDTTFLIRKNVCGVRGNVFPPVLETFAKVLTNWSVSNTVKEVPGSRKIVRPSTTFRGQGLLAPACGW